MTIPQKDVKILWVRAAGLCSMCQAKLLIPAENSSQTALIGENCHIVGEKPGSARSNETLSEEDRNRYPNLILLCNNHHKEIDDNPARFSVAVLHKLKADHEIWVETAFAKTSGPDAIYVELISRAVNSLMMKNWDGLSDNAVRGFLPDRFVEGVGDFSKHIFRMEFPGTRPELEQRFKDLSDRASAYVKHFCSNARVDVTSQVWWEDKDWKESFNPRYTEFADYSSMWRRVGIQLLYNCVVAMNLFADSVRQTLNPLFLMSNGRFVVNDSMGVMHNMEPTVVLPEQYCPVDQMPARPQ